MSKEQLQEEEERIVTLRPHSIFIIWPTLLVLLGFVLVIWIFLAVGASIWFSLAFFLWLIIGGGYFILSFLRWYLTRYIFTTKRVLIKEQLGIFKRLNVEVRLDEIAEISSQISGVWSTIFNYGDVFVRSREAEEPVVVADVYQPNQVKEELLDLKNEILKNSPQEGEEEGGEEKDQKEEKPKII